jgi:hypothetical protein
MPTRAWRREKHARDMFYFNEVLIGAVAFKEEIARFAAAVHRRNATTPEPWAAVGISPGQSVAASQRVPSPLSPSDRAVGRSWTANRSACARPPPPP